MSDAELDHWQSMYIGISLSEKRTRTASVIQKGMKDISLSRPTSRVEWLVQLGCFLLINAKNESARRRCGHQRPFRGPQQDSDLKGSAPTNGGDEEHSKGIEKARTDSCFRRAILVA